MRKIDPIWQADFSRREGFTLVEMGIAVLVFAVLVGYAAPLVLNSIQYGRVERVASRLSFQLQQARSYALANNQSVFLEVDADTLELNTWVDTDRDGVRDSGEEKEVDLGDAEVVDMTSTWTAALFNAHGQFLTAEDQRNISTETCSFSSGSKLQTLTIRGSGAVIRQ
jgi:prepilin-type N-terminal cleavage/methylation domain-containing protein